MMALLLMEAHGLISQGATTGLYAEAGGAARH
jgi:hypothetical protein